MILDRFEADFAARWEPGRCDYTLAAVAAVVTIVATVVSTVSQSIQASGAQDVSRRQAENAQTIADAQADAQTRNAAALDKQAQQLADTAGQERAASQQAALTQQQQGRFVASRARALAAASGAGAGALDPTVVDILGGIRQETDLRSATALYEGDQRAQALLNQAGSVQGDAALTRQAADITRAGGQASAGNILAQGDLTAGQIRSSAYSSAFSSLASAGSSLYDKYYKPKATNAA